MASDGDRPSLPETQDPFVLLGVSEDADDKTIKQAYAKLIRQYRPDRSPSEFQRVHAAFDYIKELRRGEAFVHRREQVPEPAAPNKPAEPSAPAEPAHDPGIEARAVADRMREAVAASPEVAVQMIDALLDEKGALAHAAWNDETVSLLVGHPTLSWTRVLRATGDRQAAVALWEQAWDHAFATDPPRAFQLLDDTQLRLDAADHPMLAELVLSRIGALAWKRSRALQGLLIEYRDALPHHPRIEWVLESVKLEVDAAVALGGVDARPLAELVPLLVASRLGSAASCRDAARSLQSWMRSDLDATFASLEQFRASTDLDPLFELLYDYFPAGRYRIDALPKDDFDRLTRKLHKIGFQPRKWLIRAGVAAVCAGIGALVGAIVPVVALVSAGVVFLSTETQRYRTQVRPRLARASLACGVTSDVMSRWVQINGGLSGRLWRYEPAIRNDTALFLFSVFATAAATLGGTDDG